MSKKSLAQVQVVGLGQACVDHLGRVPSYPPEDAKTELLDLHIQCGGPASTALVTLARLGIATSFLGSVSDDRFGNMISENLRREGVDVSLLKQTPGYTSQYAFIAVSEGTGARTIFWHRGSVPHLSPKDVSLEGFPHARVLHVDSLMVSAAAEAARQARARGMTVVMDGGTMREGMEGLLGHVDVLIASETFASPIAGAYADPEDCLRALHARGPGEVIITRGNRGSMGLGRGHFVRQRAFEVPVVDTTGAGDVFHGGYIYGILKGWEMKKCMRFAAAVAALQCTRVGAQAGIPDLEAVRRLMDGQPG
jgi:ribokinase